MNRWKAKRFEEAWQRVIQGEPVDDEMASLVEAARQVNALADPPPPPPHRLAPGRQRLLAEAARLWNSGRVRRKERIHMTGAMRLGAALVALTLVFGLVFGVGQAAADSLPGEALYELKLAAEGARWALTTDPDAEVELAVALAEARLDEVNELLAEGQAIEQATATRAGQQVTVALEAVLQGEGPPGDQVLQKLVTMLHQRQRTMEKLAGDALDEPLRQIIRIMEQVREEAHAGQGEPEGEQERQRHGTPPEPSAMPDPGQGPDPAGPKASDQPGPGPKGPQPPDAPGPKPSDEPGDAPGPGPGGVGEPADPTATPTPGGEDPGAGPSPQPTDNQPSPEPGDPNGPGGQPTEQPGGGNSGHGGGEGGKGKP